MILGSSFFFIGELRGDDVMPNVHCLNVTNVNDTVNEE